MRIDLKKLELWPRVAFAALLLVALAIPLMAALNSDSNVWGGRNVFTQRVEAPGGIDCAGPATFTGAATFGGTLAVGSNGTPLSLLTAGRATFSNAATTTASVAVAGLLASDTVLVMPQTAYSGSVYLKSAVPGAGAFTVTFSGDPGTTVALGYQVLR